MTSLIKTPNNRQYQLQTTQPTTTTTTGCIDYDDNYMQQARSPIHNSSEQYPQSRFEHPDSFDFSASSLDGIGSQLDGYMFADPMQSDSWGQLGQFPSKMGRFSHHRESSLSSLGSNGPASPYNHTTSNPQIAISDSASDGLPDMHAHDPSAANQANTYYQLAKSMSSFQGYHSLDQGMPEMAYPVTIPGPNGKPRVDRSMIPAPDFNRSHPASVASSIASDSPATPSVGETDMDRRRKGRRFGPDKEVFDTGSLAELPGYNNIPKLDRTMTDIYGDELYSPNFAITSTSPSQTTLAVSPAKGSDVFNQRINAANSQHLSVAQSPASSVSRDRSPFLSGSPHAVSLGNDMMAPHGAMPINSAQRMREQSKAKQETQFYQQQMGKVEPATPKTISPKDAILEFNEADADNTFPLFPQDSTNFEMDSIAKSMLSHVSAGDVGPSVIVSQPGVHANQFSYLPSQLSTGIQVPQQYPFVARRHLSHDTPPRLSSAGSSSVSSGSNTPVSQPRPAGVAADGGTYTCTYHGCTLRFETPALLQKHKREGHRATQGLGSSRPQDVSVASSFINSQAGPHRCDRINPSTGKSCNTLFSRPYDLTRHEDTIHNARKQKVRCHLCTEEKTFSRADALTRHYRVCHPDVDLPGKHRRRGGL